VIRIGESVERFQPAQIRVKVAGIPGAVSPSESTTGSGRINGTTAAILPLRLPVQSALKRCASEKPAREGDDGKPDHALTCARLSPRQVCLAP